MHKILIIEDDYEVSDNLREILELEKYKVYIANNGREGVEKALECMPDLIICDITMPEMNGYEVLKALRSNPVAFSIPLIFLTAKTEKSDQRQGMELGADDYITKPFKYNEILTAVKTRIEKYEKTKEYYENKLESLQKTITTVIPHEFRTPLNTILGYSQLLQRSYSEISEAEFNMMQDSIYDAGKRLLRLVVNYTTFAKLMTLTRDEVATTHEICTNVRDLIIRVTEQIARQYQRETVLIVRIEDIALNISDIYLGKIIEELVDNSFKFSYPGHQIYITGRQQEDKYIIKIKNSGRGMTDKQIAETNAFVQFEREQHEQQGSGLGLAIVKKLSDLYGFEFNIESIPNEYISVSLTFSLNKI